jgi:UDP-4-amino-4,6-dideoxy-N-acetyl-beta-L-altrosamine N-acetyltransferase
MPTKLKNFTELTHQEHEKVLSWRNDESVKKWMYTSHDITQVEHEKFIAFLKMTDAQQYFLALKDEEPIGVISFKDFDKKSVYFGLYSNPHAKIAGIGRILEEASIQYAQEVLHVKILKLEVFETNKAVINLHKKYGFIQTDTKIIKDKNVICMQREL